MKKTPKKTFFLLAFFSLIVLAVLAYSQRAWIEESWLIYKLKSENETEVDEAAHKLLAMKSIRAVPALIQQIPREINKGRMMFRQSIGLAGYRHHTNSAIYNALHQLNPPAKELLEKEKTISELPETKELLDSLKPGQKLFYDPNLKSDLPRLRSLLIE